MREKVKEAVRRSLAGVMENPPHFMVEMPEEKFGDFSTNAAMVCAKPLKAKPREVATRLIDSLEKERLFESISIAGPGFINFKVRREAWVDEFKDIPDDSSDYGSGARKREGRWLVEFVSANPTGPLHIGHGRGAAVGDTVARVLRKAGYDVTTEYYINDAGLQMENLGRSTLARFRELLGEKVEFPENGYHGEYIKDIARDILAKEGKGILEKPHDEVLGFFTRYTADTILDGIKKDLEKFRVSFAVWTSEKKFHESGNVERVLKKLQERGEIYEKDDALWLKTEHMGDEKDRVVRRANGATTYLAADIAYHEEKYERGYTDLVDIWGADHHGYVARMKASVAALGHDPASLRPLLIQLVNLKKGGEIVAMSTRSGEFTELGEVLDEVGVDAARFFFLLRSYDSHFDFDLDLAKAESSENPVYYVQYAHARISNIFATAAEKGYSSMPPKEPKWELLTLDEEMRLMKKALYLPLLVSDCAEMLSPHHLTHYLGELSGMFHRFYNSHRVVTEDKELTNARLALLSRIRTVLKNGLELLGVAAPDRM